MISFRVSESEAAEAQRRAQQLGVDRSELLREALHRYLVKFGERRRRQYLEPDSAQLRRAVVRRGGGLGSGRRLVGLGRRNGVRSGSRRHPEGIDQVLVLTRDPVADRIQAVVVAALTRTKRHLVSELELTASGDGVPSDCVVNFDNLHTLPRSVFRRRVSTLSSRRTAQACGALKDDTGAGSRNSTEGD